MKKLTSPKYASTTTLTEFLNVVVALPCAGPDKVPSMDTGQSRCTHQESTPGDLRELRRRGHGHKAEMVQVG